MSKIKLGIVTDLRNYKEYWKNFFVNNVPLRPTEKTYYYKNLVTEKDSMLWNYKVIWYGRRSHDYKCNPEDLQEEQEKIINMSKIKIEELTPKVH